MSASNDETRRNFIKTLEETAEIAEACGEKAAQAVLLALIGSLMANSEMAFLKHCCEFSARELVRISAIRKLIDPQGE